MKIICTQSQKDFLIECINKSEKCPFGPDFPCPPSVDLEGCNNIKCFEKNIEWEIKDGEQE